MKKTWWLVPVVVSLVYFGIKPVLVVQRLKEAIATRDQAAIKEQVDFLRLRESYVAEHADAMAEAARVTLQAPLADALESDIGEISKDYISPQGFIDMGQRGELGAPQPFSGASLAYVSPSQFRVSIKPKAGTSQPFALILSRQGLRWRVTTMDYMP